MDDTSPPAPPSPSRPALGLDSHPDVPVRDKRGDDRGWTADEDLRARWLPSPQQMTDALSALEQVPAADRDRYYAVVALAQPGKQVGFWEVGQPVVCLPGVWVGENTTGETTQPLRAARDAAEAAGEQWLREQRLGGTAAVALIGPDGHAAVFEGFAQVSPGDETDTPSGP